MSLTAAQQRTFDALIGRGRAPDVPPGLPERLRVRLEQGVADLDLPEPLWLGKRSLAVHPRCEGLFESVLRNEDPFELRRESAAGTLTHRAVHLDVAGERTQDVRTLVERAVPDEDRDPRFAAWWRDRDPIDRAEILQEAARDLALFRDLFPPIDRHWQPMPEQSLRVKLAGGRVVLSGRVDLMLGRTRKLLLDLKTGEPRPDHAEDMRVYALLATLFFGIPPYRVATVYVGSLECQPEDVTEQTLDHAAGRAIAAARTAAELLGAGREAELTPGPWCRWCPRAATCPAVATLGSALATVHPGTGP